MRKPPSKFNKSPYRTWTVYDGDLAYSRCVMYLYSCDGNNLWFSMHGSFLSPFYGRIGNFRSKTALQVDRKVTDKWGRNFHDCLFMVYSDLGLDFGYVENPLREVRTCSPSGSTVTP